MWKEGVVMKNRGLVFIFSSLLFAFYIGIILFILFAVVNASRFVNCGVAVAFEAIGFLLLGLIIYRVIVNPIRVGYAVPLVIATVIYSLTLDVICLLFVSTMPFTLFISLNLILLFLYCLISIPMIVTGRK